jgi:hypothetical protein
LVREEASDTSIIRIVTTQLPNQKIPSPVMKEIILVEEPTGESSEVNSEIQPHKRQSSNSSDKTRISKRLKADKETKKTGEVSSFVDVIESILPNQYSMDLSQFPLEWDGTTKLREFAQKIGAEEGGSKKKNKRQK